MEKRYRAESKTLPKCFGKVSESFLHGGGVGIGVEEVLEREKPTCASNDARVDGDFTSHKKQAKPANALFVQQDQWFDQWWEAYWRRVSRKEARAAFGKCVKTAGRFAEVMDATRKQSAEMLGRPPAMRPHGASWLNQERWTDELLEAASPQRTSLDAALDRIYEAKGTE